MTGITFRPREHPSVRYEDCRAYDVLHDGEPIGRVESRRVESWLTMPSGVRYKRRGAPKYWTAYDVAGLRVVEWAESRRQAVERLLRCPDARPPVPPRQPAPGARSETMAATTEATPDAPLSDIERAAWDIYQGWEPCEDGDHAAVPWALISPLTALFAARLGVRLPEAGPHQEAR